MKQQDPREILDTVAELILANPAMSLREIKAKMGFAQEKSIYYWLRKLNYNGIKAFREAVLTKRYLPGFLNQGFIKGEGAQEEQEDFFISTSLPLVKSFTSQGQPEIVGNRTLLMPNTISTHAFLYVIPKTTTEYLPTLGPQDIVVVEPTKTPTNGSLILIWDGKEPIFRRFYQTHPFLLVHPTRPTQTERFLTHTPGPQNKVIGQLKWLIRSSI